jgi:hypothetical protein
MTNSAYAKNNGDGLNCMVFWGDALITMTLYFIGLVNNVNHIN